MRRVRGENTLKDLKPNIVFIMADQMAAPALPMYGHKVVKAPNLERLANTGVVFENSYCNFPLCSPSRASMLTGKLCSRIGAYDNGAELPASIPTFIHHLRRLGYHTCLSGKMHFIGPDQLHGFEERLTMDIYPPDFVWTGDWEKGIVSFGDVNNVLNAGPCRRSMQLDYDEEVFNCAKQKIYDIARDKEKPPFFLAASFTHPHDPYTVTPKYWDRYNHNDIDMPQVNKIPIERLDTHSRGIYKCHKIDQTTISEEQIRNARHGYYGAISYIDDKVGQLIDTLEDAGLMENTIIIFTSDHGDMMGERGLWFKKTFWEWASRVPLIFNAPTYFKNRRVDLNVSLVDLFPTILELAGGKMSDVIDQIDGRSLYNLLRGNDEGWPDTVYSEVLAEGVVVPHIMIRRGQFKYMYGEDDKPLLFDLVADPHELNNLSGQSKYKDIENSFGQEVKRRWDLKTLEADILQSQKRRLLIQDALMKGKHLSWHFQPHQNASNRFVQLDGSSAKAEKRYHLPE